MAGHGHCEMVEVVIDDDPIDDRWAEIDLRTERGAQIEPGEVALLGDDAADLTRPGRAFVRITDHTGGDLIAMAGETGGDIFTTIGDIREQVDRARRPPRAVWC